MDTKELLETQIYPNLNVEALLSELEPKDKKNYFIIICPSCGKKEAYIPKKGWLKPVIVCNRKNKCAYISSFWNYLKNSRSLSQQETLHLLAHYAKVTLPSFTSYTQNQIKVQKQSISIIIKQYPLSLDTIKTLPTTPFQSILRTIYNFSLQTNQKQKDIYYQRRGLYAPKDIGYLPKEQMMQLTQILQHNYPQHLLQNTNIFKNNCFKYNFSSFSVIPSYDLYSNEFSALRLRNIYPSKIKEIELSNQRELNPLPYGVTKEKLHKYNTFYFTEGHIDALSLGIENFVAVEGVNSFSSNNLGLFRGKKIVFAFDQDKAGNEGMQKLNNYAKKLGIQTAQLTWKNTNIKDLNDLLQRSMLHQAYEVVL